MKKTITVMLIAALSLMLIASTPIVASATSIPVSVPCWSVPVMEKSEYYWAKYTTEITQTDIDSLIDFIFKVKKPSQEQLAFYDQNFDNNLTVQDLAILKRRFNNPNRGSLIQKVETSDIGLVSLYKTMSYSEENLKKYDLNGSGNIDELDFLMIKDFYLTQIPELQHFGDSNNVMDAIQMARTFAPEYKIIEFYSGDIHSYIGNTSRHIFLICVDGKIMLSGTERDGSFFKSIITGYHYSYFLGTLDTPTDWYCVLK